MRNSRLERSPILMYLRSEASSRLDLASTRPLRGTLPIGVPKIASAVRMLTMNLTSFVVTGTNWQDAAPKMQPRASAACGALKAFQLMSWLGPKEPRRLAQFAFCCAKVAPPTNPLNGLLAVVNVATAGLQMSPR